MNNMQEYDENNIINQQIDIIIATPYGGLLTFYQFIQLFVDLLYYFHYISCILFIDKGSIH